MSPFPQHPGPQLRHSKNGGTWPGHQGKMRISMGKKGDFHCWRLGKWQVHWEFHVDDGIETDDLMAI